MRSDETASIKAAPDRSDKDDVRGQLMLVPGGGSTWRGRARGGGRNSRMAQRLDVLAAAAEREARAARRDGDAVSARRATERAHDARRAAAMLRAGPAGVGKIMAS